MRKYVCIVQKHASTQTHTNTHYTTFIDIFISSSCCDPFFHNYLLINRLADDIPGIVLGTTSKNAVEIPTNFPFKTGWVLTQQLSTQGQVFFQVKKKAHLLHLAMHIDYTADFRIVSLFLRKDDRCNRRHVWWGIPSYNNQLSCRWARR
jgi:hypothetical protein